MFQIWHFISIALCLCTLIACKDTIELEGKVALNEVIKGLYYLFNPLLALT